MFMVFHISAIKIDNVIKVPQIGHLEKVLCGYQCVFACLWQTIIEKPNIQIKIRSNIERYISLHI